MTYSPNIRETTALFKCCVCYHNKVTEKSHQYVTNCLCFKKFSVGRYFI